MAVKIFVILLIGNELCSAQDDGRYRPVGGDGRFAVAFTIRIFFFCPTPIYSA